MIGLRKSAIATVDELLAVQHKALLAGDFTKLGGMDTALGQALNRLQRDGARMDDLRRVKAAAARNAGLIRAAQSGVATAQAQLGSARSTTLSTYDATGRSRNSTPTPSRTLSRG